MVAIRNSWLYRWMWPTARPEVGAESRWENEGGRAGDPIHAAPDAVLLDRESALLDAESRRELDDLQDELVALASIDARPRPHHPRVIAWRWFGLIALLVITTGVTWAVIAQVPWRVVVAALGLAGVLLLGMIPVISSGVLRSGKDRKTGGDAKAEHLNGQVARH